MKKPVLVFSIDMLFVPQAVWAEIRGGNIVFRVSGAANVA